MSKATRFYRDCAEQAWQGSWALANNLSATIGGLLLWAAVASTMTLDAPTSLSGTIGLAAGSAIISVIIVWAIIYSIRFILAAPRLHAETEEKLEAANAEIQSLENKTTPKILIGLNKMNGGILEIPTRIKLDNGLEIPGPMSKWVQFTVSCATAAPLIDCEARVVGVEIITNEAVDYLEEEHIHCKWSMKPTQKITIQPLIVEHANLFTLYANSLDVELQMDPPHIKLMEGIQKPGDYRVRAVVTAHGVPSQEASFLFKWRNYDDISIVQENS